MTGTRERSGEGSFGAGASLVDDPVSNWSLAAFAYDVQLRQLERSSTAAQGLLAAATLVGALAAPLLVLNAHTGIADRAVAVLLMFYIVALGLSIKHSLGVVFTSKHGLEDAGPGFVHYAHISGHRSPRAFVAYFTELGDDEQLRHVLEQVWALATLTTAKASSVRRATFWLSVGLLDLSVMIIVRFISASWI